MNSRRHALRVIDLGFREAALDAFAFLVSQHGFRCAAATESIVRFHSDRAFVNVVVDARSGELGVEIGLHDDDTRIDAQIQAAQSEAVIGRPRGKYEFSLEDVVRFSEATRARGENLGPIVETREATASRLQRLAEALKPHVDLLHGDRGAFDQLAARRSEAARVFTREVEVSQLRERVERAWRARDLPVVIQLLQRIGGDMTSTERAKLEYAERHLVD